jgi:hypothetical protein
MSGEMTKTSRHTASQEFPMNKFFASSTGFGNHYQVGQHILSVIVSQGGPVYSGKVMMLNGIHEGRNGNVRANKFQYSAPTVMT